jgi:ubiquinone/menaquinone biosynthesis C-methylase UbiE
MKEIKLITNLHLSTKRNYLDRMINKKVECMTEARKYELNYWDGPRKYGYGGYKFIPGRWTGVAKKLIKKYKLNNNSKVLDIGCGKAFLLYEIKKILPNIKVTGFDISKYGLKNAPKEIKKDLFIHKAQKKYPFKKKEFNLAISLGCLHNLEINELKFALSEINRVAKKKFIMVESYRSNLELFNLQCWALTCNSFFSKKEWIWIFKEFSYNGDYEFIYFK